MARKLFIFSVHPNDRTYKGSIWKQEGDLVPLDAPLVMVFEIPEGRNYLVVDEATFDEYKQRKLEQACKCS